MQVIVMKMIKMLLKIKILVFTKKQVIAGATPKVSYLK
jgi:hypothetical protein